MKLIILGGYYMEKMCKKIIRCSFYKIFINILLN